MLGNNNNNNNNNNQGCVYIFNKTNNQKTQNCL